MTGRTMEFGIKITADGRVASDTAAHVEKDFTRIGAAAQQANRSVETSAKQAAFAMRMLPAQMTDIAVGLASGQSPFMVLMQQGGQLKDMFGGIGPAIGAVGAFVSGLVNPFTVTAAVATGLGFALVKAFDDPREPAKDLKTAVGDLASAVDGVGKASRDFSMDKVYEEFNKANAAARQGIIEHLRYQKAMIDTQAVMAQQSLSKTLGGIGDYGFADKMMGAFAGSAGDKLSKELGVSLNLANELLPAIKGLRNGTEDAGNFMARFGTELAKSSKGDAQQLLKDIKAVADGGNDAAAAQSRLSEALQKMQAAGSNGKIEIKSNAKAVKAEVDELAVVLNKIFSKDSGLDASYWKDLETLNKAYLSGRLGVDAYRDAVAKLTTAQKFHQDELRDDAAEMKLWADAAARATLEAEKQLQSLEAKARAMEDEVRYYGLAAGEIQRTIIARLEEKRAIEASIDGNEASVEALDREIEARRRLAAAMDSKDALDANRRGLEEQQRDAQRTYEQIGQSLTDELMRGGKNARDLLERMFATLTLRPVIEGAVNIGMSAVSGALGIGGSSAASTFGSSALGNVAGNWAGSFLPGGSVMGMYSTGSYMAAGGMGFEQAAMLAAQESGLGTAATAATLEAAGASSMMATVASALPYLAAAAAVISMFSKQSTPHVGGIGFSTGNGYSTPVGRDAIGAFYANPDQALAHGMMRSDWTSRNDAAMSAQLGTAAQGYGLTFNDILKANGITGGYSVGLAFSADGEDPARGHATITDAQGNIITSYRDSNDLGSNANSALETVLTKEMPQMLLAGLEQIDINPLADMVLDSLDIESLSASSAQKALQFVAASNKIITGMEQLGISATEVSLDFINAAGGFETAAPLIESWAQLGNLMGTDVAAEVDRAGMSIASLYRLQTDQLDDLVNGYDGSLAQTQQITALMTQRYQTEIQYLQAVDAMVQSISQSVSAQSENFLLDTLGDADRYNYYDQQMASISDQIDALSDPAEIQRLAQRWLGYQASAWSMLTPEQQASNLDEFQGDLQTFDNQVSARGVSIEDSIVSDNTSFSTRLGETIRQAIADAMATPAQTMTDAANTMQDAANTPISVNVKIDLDDLAAAEVGGWVPG